MTFADPEVRRLVELLELARDPDLPEDFDAEREPADLELEPEREVDPRPPEEREPERDLPELALDVAMIHLTLGKRSTRNCNPRRFAVTLALVCRAGRPQLLEFARRGRTTAANRQRGPSGASKPNASGDVAPFDLA